jgi:hypothetical protein
MVGICDEVDLIEQVERARVVFRSRLTTWIGSALRRSVSALTAAFSRPSLASPEPSARRQRGVLTSAGREGLGPRPERTVRLSLGGGPDRGLPSIRGPGRRRFQHFEAERSRGLKKTLARRCRSFEMTRRGRV